MHRWILLRLVAACGWLLLCVSSTEAIDFAHEVVPILKKHCVKCHGGSEAKGGFSLNSRDLFLESDAAAPGDATSSYFLELIASTDPDLQMPPKDLPRVSDQEQQVLARWVNQQMPWTDGFSFAENTYQAPLLPRTVTLPGPPDRHPIDQLLNSYRIDHGIKSTQRVSDALFLRRATLDLVGLLPTDEELKEFVEDVSADKRERLIDRLLARDTEYAEHWLTFWNDLLRNDYDGTGFITGGRKQISNWLYRSLIDNKPYDVLARELIAPPSDASRGFIDGIKWRGTVSAGQTVEIQFAQSVAQSFLGINLKCASCHDSFIDEWKLSDAYSLAAVYSNESLMIHRCDKPTGEVASAGWLFPELGNIDADAPPTKRLEQLSMLMTGPRNGRFSRTIVNRLWAQLMGRGIVHPLDAMHTEPWDESLLDYLANQLVESHYDLKAILKLIATSEAYQSRSTIVEEATTEASSPFTGRRARRMTAEQFVDAVWQLTGAAPTTFDAPVVRGKIDPEAIANVKLQGEWIWGDTSNPPSPKIDSDPISPESGGSGKTKSHPQGGKEAPTETASGPETKKENRRTANKKGIAANGIAAPAGEQLVFRRVFTLPQPVVSGTAVITADNTFELYINRRKVAASEDWTRVQTVPLTKRFKVQPAGDDKQVKNEIIIVAKNLGDRPNLAALYFEAVMKLADGSELVIKSDGDWKFSSVAPRGSREGRLGQTPGPWNKVTPLGRPRVYAGVDDAFRRGLAMGGSSEPSMVRASLRKSDFLMRSLGRPNRDQIVSSRPDELTTLEAIDLANGDVLAAALRKGAEDLADQDLSPTELAKRIFRSALSRNPTPKEIAIVETAFSAAADSTGDVVPAEANLGETAHEAKTRFSNVEIIQDLMWAVLMTPEFIMIR